MSSDAIPLSRTRLKNHPRLFAAAELAVIQGVIRQYGRRDVGDIPDGLAPRDSNDPACRIPLSTLMRALNHAHAALGDAMAPRIGTALHLSTFGIPGFMLMSCATLMDALVRMQGIWLLLNLRYDLAFDSDGGRVRIMLSDRFGLDQDGQAMFALLETVRLITLCRDLVGQHFDALRIGSVSASRSERTALSHISRAELVPSAAAFIEIDASKIHAALPQANPSTHGHIGAMCDRMIDEMFGEPMLVRRIKAQMAQLESGVPALSQIAATLCLSERTLRRRLHDLGTSYYRLLDEVRMDMAERFLRDDGVTTDRIAERLGYAEVANFCHAFRRWTGSSPRHFRLQAQA